MNVLRAFRSQACCCLAIVMWLALARRVDGQSVVAHDTVSSIALRSNLLGDSPVREVLVYLPPSYRHQPSRRYPVLYLLHGFTSLPIEWLDGTYQGFNLQLTMDSLIAERAVPEFIVVMPDANNRLEGNVYLNSPVSGRWADYIVKELTSFIDHRYRTIANRGHRAIAGHSGGGFGSLVLGFENPRVYGMIYSMSPAFAGFVGNLNPTARIWLTASAPRTFAEATGRGPIPALAMALSPDPKRPRLFGRLPFEPDSAGNVVPVPHVVARWKSRMPVGLAARLRPGMAARPRIVMEAGTLDTGIVVQGVRAVAAVLDSVRVPYSALFFVGGHIDKERQRFNTHVLPAIGRWFRQSR